MSNLNLNLQVNYVSYETKNFKLWQSLWPLMTSEVNLLVLSFLRLPRAFQNGAALELALKI